MVGITVDELIQHIGDISVAIAELGTNAKQAADQLERLSTLLDKQNSNHDYDFSGFDIINYDTNPEITQILNYDNEVMRVIAPR